MNTIDASTEKLLGIPLMSDGDLIGVMETAVQELAKTPSTRGSLIRFWTGLFAMLDVECERRRMEMQQLERLYFQ